MGLPSASPPPPPQALPAAVPAAQPPSPRFMSPPDDAAPEPDYTAELPRSSCRGLRPPRLRRAQRCSLVSPPPAAAEAAALRSRRRAGLLLPAAGSSAASRHLQTRAQVRPPRQQRRRPALVLVARRRPACAPQATLLRAVTDDGVHALRPSTSAAAVNLRKLSSAPAAPAASRRPSAPHPARGALQRSGPRQLGPHHRPAPASKQSRPRGHVRVAACASRHGARAVNFDTRGAASVDASVDESGVRRMLERCA
ncbi:hypothetical protein QYE76_068250 [Lolium multiflorum]|uniref:Uncharacterized protein n=1 Tax=Lolium multiflorum TaxID=4521 RepID=A0AAD8SGD8_LOLMU|nr:hypothetical protein QYE76_068250 [Lolium multiflorum]